MFDVCWVRRLSSLVATVMVLGLAAALDAQTFEPRDDTIESQLAAFEKEPIPPEKNAARWLMAGAAAVVWSEDDTDVIGKASLAPYSEWSFELDQAVRQVLDRHRGALTTLHTAADFEESNYEIRYSEGLYAEIPDVLSLIKACRLLLAEVRVAVAEGDEGGTLTALATMGRLAASLESESTSFPVLIGIACDRMMLLAAAETLTSDQSWARQVPFLDRLDDTLSNEDPLFTAHRNIDVMHLGRQKSEAAEDDAEDTADDEERAIAVFHELVETPYGTTPEAFEKGPADKALNMNVNEIRMAIPRFQIAAAQRQFVRAGIEVWRVALSDGAYPSGTSSIPELETPDPFTGKPLLYTLHDDGSATVALDGADALLEQVVLKSAAHIPPLHLPVP